MITALTQSSSWSPPRRPQRSVRRGMTLIELIVASTVATILLGAATASMTSLIRSRDRVSQRQTVVEALYTAVQIMARDMENTVRTSDLKQVVIRIDPKTSGQAERRDELTIFSRDDRPVRTVFQEDPDYREADELEVQYRLKPDDSFIGVLWRRRDPIIDERYDGGGLAVPLAVNIRSLEFQAYDGESWVDQWDSDLDGYPYALRVICSAQVPQSGAIISAAACIALDRIAPPFDPATGETYDPSSDIRFLDFGNQGNNSGSGLDFGSPGGNSGESEGGGSTRRGPRRIIREGGDRRSGGGDRGSGGGAGGGGNRGGGFGAGGGSQRGGG